MSEVMDILLILLYILIIGPILIGVILLLIVDIDGFLSLLEDTSKDFMSDLEDTWRR